MISSDASTPLPNPPRYRWTKRLALTFSLWLLAAGATYAYWHISATNRLNALLNEAKARSEPVTFADLQLPPVPDADNAILLYDRAIAHLSLTRVEADWLTDITRRPLPKSHRDQLEAIVTRHHYTVDVARSANALPAARHGFSYTTMSSAYAGPDLGGYRRLAHLLRLDAYLHQDQYRSAAALNNVDTLLLLAQRQDSGSLIWALVMVSIDATATQALHEITPDLRIGPATPDAPPQQVRQLIARLLDETTLRANFRRGILGDRVYTLAVIDEYLPTYAKTPVGILDKARLFREISPAIDKALAPSLQDAKLFSPPISHIMGDGTILSTAARMGSINLYPSVNRPLELFFRQLAERRLAAIALAVRLYQHDHTQQLPPSLDALVPAYLPSVPLDPYTGNSPARYIPDPLNPRLYFTGGDFTDNGGLATITEDKQPTSPLLSRTRQADHIFYLRPEKDLSPIRALEPPYDTPE